VRSRVLVFGKDNERVETIKNCFEYVFVMLLQCFMHVIEMICQRFTKCFMM
jgi:hypothetical protein